MSAIQADRLRELREQRGLTQRQLAELCGLGDHQIHRYESGKSDASGDGLKAIAEQLHVTVDYLLGLSDDPHGYGTLQLRDDERKLLEAYTAGDLTTLMRIIMRRIDLLEGAAQNQDQAQEHHEED